ncbi:H-NS histone family protein [Chromobacterium haemolyticum]|uniref:H-NS histone family protein n=1 Tax=Chromobacterium haemolyticum TaxID=394935 RepID=UPI000D3272FF|nr:H-NS histone family protein [Chromobacterium haemolyticum]PTU68603.1 hypothetical protein DBB33_03670 [Chromobacterium haemolyticum]
MAKYPTAESLGIDLAALDVFQLDGLQQEAREAMNAARDKQQRETIKQIKELAASAGIDLASLAAGTVQKAMKPEGSASANKGRKFPPKYRNPANFEETWTGLGRKPVWVQTYLENGGDLDRLRIAK